MYENENLENIDVVEGVKQPEIGMTFSSMETLWDYFKGYPKEMGFPVRKSSLKKNIYGDARGVIYVCGREGFNETTSEKLLQPQATMRCQCQAKLVARLDCGSWVISQLSLEHNHELNPEQSRFYRCNRNISAHVKHQIDLLDRSGVRLNKGYSSLVNEVGGYENMSCSQKDYRNLVDKLRRLRLGDGDAAAVMKYFTKKVAENKGFYFAVDLDDEGHLRNIFWAEGRSREAYKEFGDAISFDTTYLVNKYDMPFAPFVGVNHHGQSTLFGCGLVAHEDTESFVWLFSKWLDCMSGQAPPGIITDQDKAMKKAIEIVFPQNKHRWCIWHIMKKLPEKFKSYNKYEQVTCTLKKVVYNTQYPFDFEAKWMLMLEKYGLFENEWLDGLYAERERWIHCYVKDTFWAGMSSTQRSESMNSFFDGYLTSKTSLKQFVEQYESALSDKVEKETMSDAASSSKTVPTCTMFAMEKQIQRLYTLTMFKEFQRELMSKMYCEVIDPPKESVPTYTCIIEETVWAEEKMKKKRFDVSFSSEESEVRCSCKMFEFRGILCRHAINVLIREGVEMIPDKYIVRRWRKDIKRAHTSVKVNVSSWRNTIEHDRYNHLNVLFGEVADWVANDEDEFNNVKDWIHTKMEMLKMSQKNCRSETTSVEDGNGANIGEDGNEVDIGEDGNGLDDVLDPVHTRRKGRPRSTRLQSKWNTGKNGGRPPGEEDGNERDDGNGWDGGNGEEGITDLTVPVTTAKRRGRPRGSKNKRPGVQHGTQQSQGMPSTKESVVSSMVPQPVWGLYRHPYPMEHNPMAYYPNVGANSWTNMVASMTPNVGYPNGMNPNAAYPNGMNLNAGYPNVMNPNVGYPNGMNPNAGYFPMQGPY